jgi:hypothetical protein
MPDDNLLLNPVRRYLVGIVCGHTDAWLYAGVGPPRWIRRAVSGSTDSRICGQTTPVLAIKIIATVGPVEGVPRSWRVFI